MHTLTIAHSICLTREQRYSWYEGKSLEVIGVSIPVWYKKGQTTEPANEIFCKYRLFNAPDKTFVKHNTDGYDINVTKNPSCRPLDIALELWNTLTLNEQRSLSQQNGPNPCIMNILDIKDGGCKWLAFRQHSKAKYNNKNLNLIHFVEMKPIEDLIESLV